jgi:hypothetical protein
MEFLSGLLVALFIAVIFTVIFAAVSGPFNRRSLAGGAMNRMPVDDPPPARNENAGLSVFWFFMILFLLLWAGAHWVVPAGPAFYGISWAPLLFIALVFTLIIAAFALPTRPESEATGISGYREVKGHSPLEGEGRDVGVNAFFLLLIGLLVLAILASIMN